MCSMLSGKESPVLEFVGDKIIGTWKLVSWKCWIADEPAVDYFGENPSGILMYDANGYMNAQLTQAERIPFTSQSLQAGKAEEMQQAYQSYVAYYGRYYERTPGEIVHQIEGSLFPNWVGKEEVRFATLEENQLSLSTALMHAREKHMFFEAMWVRANPAL